MLLYYSKLWKNTLSKEVDLVIAEIWRNFLLLLLVLFFHFLSYMSFFPFSLIVVVLLKFRRIPFVVSIFVASKSLDFRHVVVPTNFLISLQKGIEVYSEGDIYLLDRVWDVVNFLSSWRLDGFPSLDLDVLQVAFFKWTFLMTWLVVPFTFKDGVAWYGSLFDLFFL